MARALTLAELRRGRIREEMKEYVPPELSGLVEEYDYFTYGRHIALTALDLLPLKSWVTRDGERKYPWVRINYTDISLEVFRKGENLWDFRHGVFGAIEEEFNVSKMEVELIIAALERNSQIVRVTVANGILTDPNKSYNKPDSTYAIIYENVPGEPGYDPELI